MRCVGGSIGICGRATGGLERRRRRSLFLRDSLSLCGVDVLSERVVRKVVVPDATKLCESL